MIMSRHCQLFSSLMFALLLLKHFYFTYSTVYNVDLICIDLTNYVKCSIIDTEYIDVFVLKLDYVVNVLSNLHVYSPL